MLNMSSVRVIKLKFFLIAFINSCLQGFQPHSMPQPQYHPQPQPHSIPPPNQQVQYHPVPTGPVISQPQPSGDSSKYLCLYYKILQKHPSS